MIYQLTTCLFFEDEDPINDIKDKILDHFPDAIVVNPRTPQQECSWYQLDECHHDETPPTPCILLVRGDNCPP